MPIERLRLSTHSVPLATKSQTLYEVELSSAPSRAWRASLLRSPPRLRTTKFTPELGRLGLDGNCVTFRTTPPQLRQWLRRINRWMEYANLVVGE